MLIYEYKLGGNQQQYQALDEAIRSTQFIRIKCLRKWMDERRVSKNDLQCSCAVLVREDSFAALLNSQFRQVHTCICPACGLALDRDENAAKNILHAGLLILLLVACTGTIGQTRASSDEENASGLTASTRCSPRGKTSKRPGRNKNLPASSGESVRKDNHGDGKGQRLDPLKGMGLRERVLFD